MDRSSVGCYTSRTRHATPRGSHAQELHMVPEQSAEPSGIVDHSANADVRNRNPQGQTRSRIWGLAAATQVDKQPYPPLTFDLGKPRDADGWPTGLP